jgi:hypothetical protein
MVKNNHLLIKRLNNRDIWMKLRVTFRALLCPRVQKHIY